MTAAAARVAAIAAYRRDGGLFERVTLRWTQVLGTRVTPAQVAPCLIDLKVARLAHDPRHVAVRHLRP